jgi:hypothetical protein
MLAKEDIALAKYSSDGSKGWNSIGVSYCCNDSMCKEAKISDINPSCSSNEEPILCLTDGYSIICTSLLNGPKSYVSGRIDTRTSNHNQMNCITKNNAQSYISEIESQLHTLGNPSELIGSGVYCNVESGIILQQPPFQSGCFLNAHDLTVCAVHNNNTICNGWEINGNGKWICANFGAAYSGGNIPEGTINLNFTDSSNNNLAIILGSVLGGVAFILILIGCIIFYRKRKNRSPPEKPILPDEEDNFT